MQVFVITLFSNIIKNCRLICWSCLAGRSSPSDILSANTESLDLPGRERERRVVLITICSLGLALIHAARLSIWWCECSSISSSNVATAESINQTDCFHTDFLSLLSILFWPQRQANYLWFSWSGFSGTVTLLLLTQNCFRQSDELTFSAVTPARSATAQPPPAGPLSLLDDCTPPLSSDRFVASL